MVVKIMPRPIVCLDQHQTQISVTDADFTSLANEFHETHCLYFDHFLGQLY